MADFPNRIRELRKELDWSQDRLADEVGCAKAQISDLERGNRGLTVDWMRRIGEAMGVSPGELLSRADNPLLPQGEERALVERYRGGTPEQQDNLTKVADALIPYRSPPPEEEKATPKRDRAA